MSFPTVPPAQDPNSADTPQWQAPHSAPPSDTPVPDGVPVPSAGQYGSAQTPPGSAGTAQHPQYGQPQYGQPQYGQPQYGQPQYGQPQYGHPQYGQPAGGYGAPAFAASFMAPKPGIIPLRPLNLGDLLQGSITALRANPSVMFGFTMAVMAVAALISGFTAAFFVPSPDEISTLDGTAPDEELLSVATYLSGSLVSSAATYLVLFLATTLLTGVLALTVSDAVIGRKTDLSSAWQRLRPRLGTLVGYSLFFGFISSVYMVLMGGVMFLVGYLVYQQTPEMALAVLTGLLPAPLLFIPLIYINIRLVYAPTIITLEHQGIFTSMRRSWVLTTGSFWVTLGRYMAITFLTSLVSSFLGAFVGLIMAVGILLLPYSLASGLTEFSTVLVSGIILPVVSAFITLMYVDSRIRTEGLADSLLRASES